MGLIAAVGFSSIGHSKVATRRMALFLLSVGSFLAMFLMASRIPTLVNMTLAHAGRPPEVTVRYEGTAEHQGETWALTERITLDARAIEAIQRLLSKTVPPISLELGTSRSPVGLGQQLAPFGWRDGATIDSQSSFLRTRQVTATAPGLSGSFTSTLPIVDSLGKSRVFRLIPNGDSHLRIIAPVGLVGVTSPPSDRRPITGRREQFEVSLDPPESQQREVQVQLLSPVLRSKQGQAIVELTASGWFDLLLTLIVMLLAFTLARAKQQLLEPIIDQALSRLGRRRSPKDSNHATRQRRKDKQLERRRS